MQLQTEGRFLTLNCNEVCDGIMQPGLGVVSILDSRFSILDSWFLILDSRFSILGPRSQVPSPKSQVPVPVAWQYEWDKKRSAAILKILSNP